MNNNDINNIEVNNNSNNKNSNFSKIILIIVIVVVLITAYFAFSVLLSVKSTTSVLDKARASSFVSDAKSFISNARNIVFNEELDYSINKSTKYVKSCDTNYSFKIYLNDLNNDNLLKSPFGNKYDLNNSFINVDVSKKNNKCVYNYSIYLTDNVYSIGNSNNLVLENNITYESVHK